MDLRVRVQPRAKRDEIVGERDGALVVRVSAPPVEGKANEALVTLIARTAALRRSSVEVVRGERSRDKLVRIAVDDERAVRRALGLQLPE